MLLLVCAVICVFGFVFLVELGEGVVGLLWLWLNVDGGLLLLALLLGG